MATELTHDVEVVDPCPGAVEALDRAGAGVPDEFSVEEFTIHFVFSGCPAGVQRVFSLPAEQD